MSMEVWIALLGLLFAVLSALGSYIAARAGTNAALDVHLHYLRRDVNKAARDIDAAHWRLDEIGAPAAPLES